MKLTKRAVEAAQPSDKDILIRDSELKGFLCKITPKGRRVYMLYYRTKEGRERKPAIGEHGKITCEQARDIAKRWMAEVHDGGDPSLHKQESRKALSVSEFAQKYMQEYAAHKKKGGKNIDERIWRLHVVPHIGKYPLSAITKADIGNLHRSMITNPANANRVLALLKRAFSVAIEWGDLKTGINPAASIRKYPEKSRERFLSTIELAWIGEALRQCEVDQTVGASAALAIRLLILTGCRRNEILELQWDWIHFDRSAFDLPDSKTGKKTIYLNPPTLEALSGATKVKGNPYVVTGKDGVGHWVNIQKSWRRVLQRAEILRLIDKIAEEADWSPTKRETAKTNAGHEPDGSLQATMMLARKHDLDPSVGSLLNVRIHDLRHSFASTGAASGMSLLMIGKLLGHKESKTTERYAHLVGDPMREASNRIGSHIQAALDGDKAEIISFRNNQARK